MAKIARNTADLIGLGRDLRDAEITVLPGWAGDFYGIPVASTLDAIRLTGTLEGVILDPVYEGKSMAGLIDLVRSGDIGPDSTVLFVPASNGLATKPISHALPVDPPPPRTNARSLAARTRLCGVDLRLSLVGPRPAGGRRRDVQS